MTTLQLNRPSALTDPHPLSAVLEAGRERARTEGIPVLVSVSEPVPALDPLAAFTIPIPHRVYWEHRDPETGHHLALAGLGSAYSCPTDGEAGFATAASAWRALLANALIEGPKHQWGVGPLLMGGFRFDPLAPQTALWRGFGTASLTLPSLILATIDGQSWLTTSIVLHSVDNGVDALDETLRLRAQVLRSDRSLGYPDRGKVREPQPQDVMPAQEWQHLVGETARQIRDGALAKVVLARQVALSSAEHPFDPTTTLARLRRTFPSAFLFAVARPGDAADEEAVFLGASPERLVRLSVGSLATSCLAGSIGRGATAAEDAALGARLLASAKDREEHAVVARMLREQLAPLCADLEIAAAPELARLPNVQHLHTAVHGTLATRDDGTRPCILDLVARLHPTPAMGGSPRPEAMAFIRRHEGLDRGWYAAPVGWLDRRGEGEFAVAIRSALLRGREARLFAGCGIVGDSDPQSEYLESRLKLRAMLGALLDDE